MVKPRDRQATFEEQWRPNLPKKVCMLDEIDEFVDWEPIERRLIKMYKKDNGRPAIPASWNVQVAAPRIFLLSQ